MLVAARVHVWPWSGVSDNERETVDLSRGAALVPFYGSPVISMIEYANIFLPSRHERFMTLGPPFRSLADGFTCQLYEVPQGIVSNGISPGTLSIHYETERTFVQIQSEGALPRFEGTDETGKPRESVLAGMVLYWAQYFDELMEKAKKDDEQNVRLDWQAVLHHLEQLRDQETGQPRRALIVDIAERMTRRLPQTVMTARRILLRERRLLSAARIEQTDSSCLRWFIRQPGQTAVEKSGPRQELMGIARHETFNVHENRILKDFLIRCREEGNRYFRRTSAENPAYKATTRVRKVQTYSTLCAQLSRVPHLDSVARPVPNTPPNYVLLHDMRYRDVWHWYKKLLRRAEEEDRFWDWQCRTWADIVRVLVSLALVHHVRELSADGKLRLTEICQASLRLHGEQMLGCRAASGSEPGPLHVRSHAGNRLGSEGVLEIVHPELAQQHPLVAHLGAMGGHLYLVLRPLGEQRPTEVVVVWAVHTAAAACLPGWTDIGNSAEHAIRGYQAVLRMARMSNAPRIKGLVLASDLRTARATCEVERKDLVLLRVPAEPRYWMTAVEEDITLAIDELLLGMLS